MLDQLMVDEAAVIVAKKPEGLKEKSLAEKLKEDLLAAEHGVTNQEAKLAWEERYKRAENFIDDLGEQEQQALRLVMESIALKPIEERFRKRGEPLIYHCIEVAMILEDELGVKNENIRTAAILHDYLEDIKIVKPETFEIESQKIRTEFGDAVWRMVSGMTKFKFDGVVYDEMTYGNVLMEAAFEPGILLIRLDDRIHNWRTIGGQKKLSKRAEAAIETEEFFLPIARKVGIQSVIDELEAAVAKVKEEVDTYNETVEESKRIVIDPKQKAMVERSLNVLFRNGVLKRKLKDLMDSRSGRE